MNKDKEKKTAIIITIVVCVCGVIAFILACTSSIAFNFGENVAYTLKRGDQVLYCTNKSIKVDTGRNTVVYSKQGIIAPTPENSYNRTFTDTDTFDVYDDYRMYTYSLMKGSSIDITVDFGGTSNGTIILLKGYKQYELYLDEKHDRDDDDTDDDDDDDHHHHDDDDTDDDDDDDDDILYNLCDLQNYDKCEYTALGDSYDPYFVIIEKNKGIQKLTADVEIVRNSVLIKTNSLTYACGPLDDKYLNKNTKKNFCILAENTSPNSANNDDGADVFKIYFAHVLGSTFLIGIVIVVFIVIFPLLGCVYLRERRGWGAKKSAIMDEDEEEIELGGRDDAGAEGAYNNEFAVSLLQEQVKKDEIVDDEMDAQMVQGQKEAQFQQQPQSLYPQLPPPTYDPYPIN